MNNNKTKICKYCRSEIDAKASVCPNCKKEQNSGCLTVVALLIVILGFIALGKNSKKQEKVNVSRETAVVKSVETNIEKVTEKIPETQEAIIEPETAEEITEEQTTEEQTFSYEVTDSRFSYYTDSIGLIEYYGFVEITNTGSCNIYLSDCTFDLEDNDGHLLQSDNFISKCPDVIAPGEKGYFYNGLGACTIDSTISLDNGINLVPNYKIEKATGEVISFDVSDTDMRNSDYGYTKITGRISNNTDKDCSYLYVNVIFYDVNGKALMITGTNVTDLAAGTTKSFEVSTTYSDESVSREDIATYQVIARGIYYQW